MAVDVVRRSVEAIEADLRSARIGLDRLRDLWLARTREACAEQEAVVERLQAELDAAYEEEEDA